MVEIKQYDTETQNVYMADKLSVCKNSEKSLQEVELPVTCWVVQKQCNNSRNGITK